MTEIRTESMFKSGWQEADDQIEEVKIRQQEFLEQTKFKELWITQANPRATVRFLMSEPITYYAHRLGTGSKFRNFTCRRQKCEICEEFPNQRPQFRGIFLVWDYADSNIKYWARGVLDLAQIKTLSTIEGKDSLKKRDITLIKIAVSAGGSSIQYIPGAPSDFTPGMSNEEIKSLFKEANDNIANHFRYRTRQELVDKNYISSLSSSLTTHNSDEVPF